MGYHEIHGRTGTTEYISWTAMRARCRAGENSPFHKYYKGKGITVCKKWDKSFEDFLQDMGHKPTEKHSVERIDNNGNYCPENCKWATRKEQARNRKQSTKLTYYGITRPIGEWAEMYGLEYKVLYNRLYFGWNPRRALNTPLSS
jgi:predicted nucleic acid-binding Zn ribbon protein